MQSRFSQNQIGNRKSNSIGMQAQKKLGASKKLHVTGASGRYGPHAKRSEKGCWVLRSLCFFCKDFTMNTALAVSSTNDTKSTPFFHALPEINRSPIYIKHRSKDVCTPEETGVTEKPNHIEAKLLSSTRFTKSRPVRCLMASLDYFTASGIHNFDALAVYGQKDHIL